MEEMFRMDPALFARVRKDCFDHVDGAENVSVEQLPDVGVARFLHRGAVAVAVAGIVDEDVNASEARPCLLHHRADLFPVGDIEGKGECRVGESGRDVFQR